MSELNNNVPMRITQLPEATAYEEGMYYAVAKAGYGTKKIAASVMNDKTKLLDGMLSGDAPSIYAIDYSITFGGKYSTSGKGYLFPVKSGDIAIFENADRASYYSVLKSKSNMYSGGTPDFATGYSGIIQFRTSTQITIPEDGNYIWFYGVAGGVDYCPTKLTINGYDVLKNVYENITDLSNVVEANDEIISNIDKQISLNSITSEYLSKSAISGSAKWNVTNYYSSYIVPCKAGQHLKIWKEGTGYYSILKSKSGEGTQYADVDFATGYTGYVVYRSSTGGVDITIPEDGNFVWVYKTDNQTDYSPSIFELDEMDVYNTLRGNVVSNKTAISDLKEEIDDLQNSFSNTECAKGEKDGLSPFDGTNLAFQSIIPQEVKTTKKIVCMSHDDLQPSDYINVRKIYNKYGFKANFNFILMPFGNATVQKSMVENVKKLLKEGHTIGLHAIFQESFWWMNKCFDVSPSSDFTFAPTLSQIKTDIGSGKNVFGQTINMSAALTSYGFVNLPTSYASTPLSDILSNDYVNIIKHYTLYNNETIITGLDLEGTSQSWTMLHWLEYWYNNLIDDSLGFSTYSGTIAERYATDYEVPSGETASDYYPDASHLETGKVVFFDDTNNPNYSDANYQKVGRFSVGLFKGAASSCNYEVRERCIEIAKAFCLYYFESNRFVNYGRHGVTFVNLNWESNYNLYDNQDKTILAGEFGKVFNTIKQKWETGLEILLSQGIKTTSHNTPLSVIYMNQYGLYYGQEEERSPFFSYADWISYLTLAGTSSSFSGGTVDNAKLIKILSEHEDNLLKFVYENAGTQVSSKDGTATYYIHPYVKNAIDKVRARIGAGKIPFLSVDTIVNDSSNIYAVELLSQYCYYNNIDIVSTETARIEATKNNCEIKNNYFPNPNFNQSLLNMFGGSSTSKDAYLPDCWENEYRSTTLSYNVTRENSKGVFNIVGNGTGANFITMRIWGLPSGTYQFNYKGKKTGNETPCRFVVRSFKNGTNLRQNYYGDVEFYDDLTNDFVEYSHEIIIPETIRNQSNDSAVSQYCDGFEDNTIQLYINVGWSIFDNSTVNGTITLKDVELVRV